MSDGNDARQQIIEEVRSCVCDERYKQYGDAQENFEDTAQVWTWWLRGRGLLKDDAELTSLDFGQMMLLMKVSRSLRNLEYLDTFIDEVGYAVCSAGIIKSEREPRDEGHDGDGV